MRHIKMLLIAVISCCLCISATAQEKKGETSNATTLIQDIGKHIDDGQWSEVAKRMTAEAWDSWCQQLVVECLSIAKIDSDMEFGLPGMDKAQEKIVLALEKHGLDKIEIKKPSIEIRMHEFGDGDEEVEVQESDEKDSKELTKKILAALDADGKENRFAVIQELWQARSGSPFSVSVFAGKVQKEETEGETVNLTISPKVVAAENDEAGVMIQIEVPPVVIDVRKVDGQWKYVGMNEKKSAEAMKNYKPKMGGGSDFSDF